MAQHYAAWASAAAKQGAARSEESELGAACGGRCSRGKHLRDGTLYVVRRGSLVQLSQRGCVERSADGRNRHPIHPRNLIGRCRLVNLRSPQIFLRVFSSCFPAKYFRNASRNDSFSPTTVANNVIE